MTIHPPLTPQDRATVAAIAEQSAPFKGMMNGPEARAGYDEMIAAVPAAAGVTTEAASLGGVSGYWLRPDASPGDAAILYLHGGGYVLGSAAAYCNIVSQFAARTGLAVFAPDYALAPEHPFPAGVSDARAVWQALQVLGFRRIVILGDSAGGGLSLSLLHWAQAEAEAGRGTAPAAAVVISPWTDLSLAGESMKTKADEDPFLTEAMLRTLAGMYLGTGDPKSPFASPIVGARAGLPPVQIHVGTREILLDDSIAYAARVRTAGGAVDLHVWEGMPHVFSASFAILDAGETAMALMADFVRSQVGH